MNLVETDKIRGLSKELSLLRPICEFLTQTHIDSDEEYKKSLSEFKENMKVFYQSEEFSYLREGKNETFYLYCLKYYMPHITDITHDRHKLGVGIFTMQGFERRNKEIKIPFGNFLHLIENRKIY